jgi:PKD repeat protein
MVDGRLVRMIAAATIAGLSTIGCNLKPAEIPEITGPSEFAFAVAMTATPDLLPEDGASQAVIGIVVRDTAGQPVRNCGLFLENTMGILSAHNVTTDANGRASVAFTSPKTLFPTGGIAVIFATIIGNNYDNSRSSNVTIRLVPPTVISVPGAPIADFVYSPASPKVGQLALFNASSSFDPDGTITTYEWNWGDGDVNGFGVNQDHDFLSAGTFNVTLRVTDNSGLQSSITKSIVVVP